MTATTETTVALGVQPEAAGTPHTQAHGQQHPIRIYLVVWALLFVLSTASYLVDYFNLHGALRWTLILLFMWLKAGCIVAIFMHMAWERLALILAILSPPGALAIFLGVMAFEGDYTKLDRSEHFPPIAATAPQIEAPPVAPPAPPAPTPVAPPVAAAPPKAETPSPPAPALEKPVQHRHARHHARTHHR